MQPRRWTHSCAYRCVSKNNTAPMLYIALMYLGTGARVYSFSTQQESNELCLGKHIAVAENVECEIKNSENASCKISLLDENSCYATYNECKGANVEYDETPSIRGTNFTDILFWNLAETSTIVMTTRSPQKSWLLETNNAKEVKLIGLSGRINSNKNPRLFKTENCTGCPLPRIKWYPLRKLHKMYFKIPPEDHDPVLGENWEITLYSSNKTNFTANCIYYAFQGEHKAVNGSVNEKLAMDGIYSTEYCFIVHFTEPQNNRTYKYSCGRSIHMTEMPDNSRSLDIPLPTWWIFVLATMLLILLIATVLVSTYKGWLRLCVGRLQARSPQKVFFKITLKPTTNDEGSLSPTEDEKDLRLFLPKESPTSNGRAPNGAHIISVASIH